MLFIINEDYFGEHKNKIKEECDAFYYEYVNEFFLKDNDKSSFLESYTTIFQKDCYIMNYKDTKCKLNVDDLSVITSNKNELIKKFYELYLRFPQFYYIYLYMELPHSMNIFSFQNVVKEFWDRFYVSKDKSEKMSEYLYLCSEDEDRTSISFKNDTSIHDDIDEHISNNSNQSNNNHSYFMDNDAQSNISNND